MLLVVFTHFCILTVLTLFLELICPLLFCLLSSWLRRHRKFYFLLSHTTPEKHLSHFQVFVRWCGLLDISLRLLVVLFLISILATLLWWTPFKFIPTWNCILMRNQEVVEQPMVVETLPRRLLTEAQQFIKR